MAFPRNYTEAEELALHLQGTCSFHGTVTSVFRAY